MAKLVYADKLSKGEVVVIYLPESDKKKPGEYLVETVDFDQARRGMGGMDEGSPDTWEVVLRRLNDDGSYNSKARPFRTSYSTWHGKAYLYCFEKTGRKMNQEWV